MSNDKKINKFLNLTFYFFIYACLGWIFEELFCIATMHEFIKRGFLYGPICPIYGYGALFLILFFRKYEKKPISLFFLSAILFTIFEYITDFVLQSLFAMRFWDYTGYFLNLNGRITISFSLIWGSFSILFIKLLHPFITKIFNKYLCKIPNILQKITAITLLLLLFSDTILSSIKYLKIIM